MHLYAIMRGGVKKDQDYFIEQLIGKWVPYTYLDPTGKPTSHYLQLAVRPVTLWEFGFPEEAKDIVLATILGPKKTETYPPNKYGYLDKYMWVLRRALQCEKVPDYKSDQVMPIVRENLEMIPIGIKKDYYQDKDGNRYAEKPTEPVPVMKIPDTFEGI